MTGLNQANLRKRLAEVHVEENIRDMEIARAVIAVSIFGSFVSLLVSFFVPWSVFVFAGFLGMASYTLLLRANIQEDLEVAQQRYRRACERKEKIEKEFLMGEDYP